MKKLLPWEESLIIAIIAFFLKYLLRGAIGDIFSIVGVVFLIKAYLKFKKLKHGEKLIEDTHEK